MGKIYIYEKQTDKEKRNAQIVYMAKVLGMQPKQIAEYVDLARKTISNYIRTYADLLEKAKEWFTDKIEEIKEKVTNRKGTKKNYRVIENVTFENCIVKKAQCAYIIEYFDNNHNFLFLKVGKTKDIRNRIKSHFKEYKKYNATYAVVKELHYAEDDEDALTLENLYRKHYKAIPNCGFIKNDRFKNIRYNAQDLQNDTVLITRVSMFEMAAA